MQRRTIRSRPMNTQTKFPAKTQRHEAQSPLLLAYAQTRSLSSSARRSCFAPLRLCGKFLLIVLALVFPALLSATRVSAQEVGDTIRINTRVVFLDALVKDKRTGIPISNLKP